MMRLSIRPWGLVGSVAASVSPTVSPEMADQIGNLLFALERTEAGQELLAGLKKTTKFDEPPAQLAATMKQIQELDRSLAD